MRIIVVLILLFNFMQVSSASFEELSLPDAVNELSSVQGGEKYIEKMNNFLTPLSGDEAILHDLSDRVSKRLNYLAMKEELLTNTEERNMIILSYLFAWINHDLLWSNQGDAQYIGDDVPHIYRKIDSSLWSMGSSRRPEMLKYAIDGNMRTRWTTTQETQRPGQFIEIDLHEPQSFNRITLDSQSYPRDYIRGYAIYTSHDKIHWEHIMSGNNTESFLEIYLENQYARYIKIEQTAYADRWWSLAELKLHYIQ